MSTPSNNTQHCNGEMNCIHLYACRRIQAMYKAKGKYIPRNCDKEKCNAFVDGSLLTNCINRYEPYKYGSHDETYGITCIEDTPNVITLADVIANEINEDQDANGYKTHRY